MLEKERIECETILKEISNLYFKEINLQKLFNIPNDNQIKTNKRIIALEKKIKSIDLILSILEDLDFEKENYQNMYILTSILQSLYPKKDENGKKTDNQMGQFKTPIFDRITGELKSPINAIIENFKNTALRKFDIISTLYSDILNKEITYRSIRYFNYENQTGETTIKVSQGLEKIRNYIKYKSLYMTDSKKEEELKKIITIFSSEYFKEEEKTVKEYSRVSLVSINHQIINNIKEIKLSSKRIRCIEMLREELKFHLINNNKQIDQFLSSLNNREIQIIKKRKEELKFLGFDKLEKAVKIHKQEEKAKISREILISLFMSSPELVDRKQIEQLLDLNNYNDDDIINIKKEAKERKEIENQQEANEYQMLLKCIKERRDRESSFHPSISIIEEYDFFLQTIGMPRIDRALKYIQQIEGSLLNKKSDDLDIIEKIYLESEIRQENQISTVLEQLEINNLSQR